MNSTMRHATLKDVAKKAEVSLATASRALNNREDVDQDTRKKVLETAKALSYSPNPLARGLLSGTTKTIGVLVSTIQNPFYGELVAGIEKALAEEGYTTILCNSHEDAEAERVAVELLLRRRVDGLIIAPVQSKPDGLAFLLEQNTPFVFAARYMPGVDTDYVICDDELVGRMVTDHLIEKGYRRILFMNSCRNSSAELRQQGYEKSLRSHDIPMEPALIRTVEYGQQVEEVMDAAFQEGLKPSAIFCFCDEIAVGVLNYLNKEGIKVPDDIAMASCDNLPYTGLLQPPLTSVDVSKFEMGVEAVKILLAKIKRDKKKTTQVVLEPKLIERASSNQVMVNNKK
ncbi:MAG TPA: LacI family transcriptional regulator [Firmicutes bacterium]|nr:LacI family transcriptional regulator [Bacillota bacterium]